MQNTLPIIYMLIGALLFIAGSYYNYIMFRDKPQKVANRPVKTRVFSSPEKPKPKTPEDIAEEKLNNCYQ